MLKKQLRNPYFIGLLLFLSEIVINITFGSSIVSSGVLGYAAGTLFTWRNQRKMLRIDKFKTLAIYLTVVIFIVLTSTVMDGFNWYMLGAVLLFIVVYGALIYLMMTLGSTMTYKVIASKKIESKKD